MGVVVGLPGESAASYHLRLPGGGGDWRATSDGSTLRPVAVPVTHVTPHRWEALPDWHERQTALPVTVHHEDGGTSESLLLLTPSQVKLCQLRLGQPSRRRELEGEGTP
ncbi:hypothetical protein AB0J21_05820 [Streptomyces sp. NPDC049954]|uniref:hypothetical protein n=1 Tax=Streptomyces sp. NPDC049954 TaxID=3155779 RepID=UPI00342CE14E